MARMEEDDDPVPLPRDLRVRAGVSVNPCYPHLHPC